MKFSLSKNKYSGEVYLRNMITILILAMQSNGVEAKSLRDRADLNKLNEASWRIIAHNTIVDAKEGSWIKNEKKYGESIRKVIGKAIADCVADMGEFANKKCDDVVVFATTPNDTHYTTQNWNAVVLYNYLHKLKCDFEECKEHYNDTIFDELQKTITQYYEEKYKIDNISEKIKDAIRDIKEYAKELHLYDAMNKFIKYDKLPQEIENDRDITPELHTIYVQQFHGDDRRCGR